VSALFAGGGVVDVILLLVVLEASFLIIHHRVTGRGIAPASFLWNLLSGACLMLAVRAALVSAWWGWVAACLAAAGLAHLADLLRLWRLRSR
jgi:hypothetical protein